MLSEWRKFKGWSVLEFFLSHPNTRIHIKELARTLNISPQTSNRYLKLYESENLLDSESIGNLNRFYLNNRYQLIKEFKRLYFIFLLHENNFVSNFIKQNRGVVGLCLYGSHSSGEYYEKSEIDLLVISQSKEIDISAVKRLEKQLDKITKVTVFTVGEWKELINRDDPFVKSVLSSHVMLYDETESSFEKKQPDRTSIVGENGDRTQKIMGYVYEEE